MEAERIPSQFPENLSFDIVWKNDSIDIFPINILRNVAVGNVITPYSFLIGRVNIFFMPFIQKILILHLHLEQRRLSKGIRSVCFSNDLTASAISSEIEKTLLIIPAFEYRDAQAY